ncbi:PBP1A family penicillin-binding protein [bacterium]|nr:PBP1A family penicillin-binding protein [bacterium]
MKNPFTRRKIKRWLVGNRRSPHAYTARKRKVRLLSLLVGITLFIIFLGATGSVAVIAIFSKDLPSPDKLSDRDIPQSTKIYSNDGVLLYEIFGDERRTLVTLEDIPEELKQATIAVEDSEFYSHPGFDVMGILRAASVIVQGEGVQGGSTLTQQVVKNTLLTPERTIARKIKEFILSIELERKYSKDEILQMYFNESPYGGQAWGVGAASEMYFGKHVRDLSLAESTYIAGLPQGPSLYSPCGAYPENAVVRQEMVLNAMIKNGYLTEEQKTEVLDTKLSVLCTGYGQDSIKAPHFVMYVKSILTQMFGEKMVEQGGLRVTTSLDWSTQQIAQEEVEKQIANLAAAHANASNAGVISTDPKTGEILAMVGSVDYFDQEHDGNVNVILSERQPGSSIKPLVYLTAFTLGYSPATFVSDIRTCFPGGAGQPDYCPVNWDGKYWGPMDIRTALSNSRNIPAVKTLQAVGMQNMIDLAHQLGITTLNDLDRYGLSLALGGGEVRPLDMAQVFSVFANMGEKVPLKAILHVEDSNGTVLFENTVSAQRIVDPGYVYLLNDVLSDSSERKRTFGNSFEIGRTIATKTGTTNDNKDAWTVGYTPDFVTVVWVGNFDNEPMNGIQGSTGATPIMKGVVTRALQGVPSKSWDRPENVSVRRVDSLSGLIPQEGRTFPTNEDIFFKGTEPTQIDDFHVVAQVCTADNNKLATDFHKDKGLSAERTFTVLKEISSNWQPFTNEWMDGLRSDGYGAPPTEYCDITIEGKPADGPVLEVSTPQDSSTVTLESGTATIPVHVTAYTSERITKVDFYWDAVLLGTVTSEPYTYNIDLSSLSSEARSNGSHQITVHGFDSTGSTSSVYVTVNLKGNTAVKPSVSPSVTKTP